MGDDARAEPHPVGCQVDVEQMRKYSQCMRDNGVPDFPDPDASGLEETEIGPKEPVSSSG